jgi:hypothetical protein
MGGSAVHRRVHTPALSAEDARGQDAALARPQQEAPRGAADPGVGR